MKHYTLKLKTTSTVDYNLYDGTTLMSDTQLNTLFATAGEAYFTFDFNSLTPTDTTSLNILNSSSTAVIANTGLTGIAEDKNFKGTWSASATAFDTFVALTGVAMDEAQINTLAKMIKSAGPTIAQEIGTSNTSVMSQRAASQMVYNGDVRKVSIGANAAATANWSAAIFGGTNQEYAVAIGYNAHAEANGAVALGAGSSTSTQGVLEVGLSGASSTFQGNNGYNGSAYRLLSGLYDPQSAHDAATKWYVDNNIPATFTTNEWDALWA